MAVVSALPIELLLMVARAGTPGVMEGIKAALHDTDDKLISADEVSSKYDQYTIIKCSEQEDPYLYIVSKESEYKFKLPLYACSLLYYGTKLNTTVLGQREYCVWRILSDMFHGSIRQCQVVGTIHTVDAFEYVLTHYIDSLRTHPLVSDDDERIAETWVGEGYSPPTAADLLNAVICAAYRVVHAFMDDTEQEPEDDIPSRHLQLIEVLQNVDGSSYNDDTSSLVFTIEYSTTYSVYIATFTH